MVDNSISFRQNCLFFIIFNRKCKSSDYQIEVWIQTKATQSLFFSKLLGNREGIQKVKGSGRGGKRVLSIREHQIYNHSIFSYQVYKHIIHSYSSKSSSFFFFFFFLIISPMLFNIYMRPLGGVIRRCGASCHQYADDTQPVSYTHLTLPTKA